jgi:hypothetical protein
MDRLFQVQEQKKDQWKHPLSLNRTNIEKKESNNPFHSTLLEMQKAYGNRYVQELVSGTRTPCPELCGINEPLVDIPTRPTAQFKPHSCDSCFFHPKRPIKQTSVGTSDSSNGHSIQTKLIVGQPGDVYEQEADKMAEAVLQRQCTSPKCEEEVIQGPTISPIIQRQGNSEEEEEEKELGSIQAKQTNAREGESEAINEILKKKGTGVSLDQGTREFMESRFGYDFSDVRVHTDSYAAKKSQELNSEAFTIGRNIFFNERRYNPSLIEGKRLLAHELTHVMQQNNSKNQTMQFLCTDHDQESYYRSNSRFCRDTESTGSEHLNHRCYREIPTGSGCPPGEHVCFKKDTGECDFRESHIDSTAPTLSRINGRCDLSWSGWCTILHGIRDWLPWKISQKEQAKMKCIEECRKLPWYSRLGCMEICEGGPD